jgi:hypothetical protein
MSSDIGQPLDVREISFASRSVLDVLSVAEPDLAKEPFECIGRRLPETLWPPRPRRPPRHKKRKWASKHDHKSDGGRLKEVELGRALAHENSQPATPQEITVLLLA